MSRTSPNRYFRKAPYDSDKATITLLVSQGLSDSEIAEKYGVTRDTIWCRRQAWNIESGCGVKENKLKADMLELWKNGYTIKEVASVLGISVQVTYSKMREYNIRKTPRMGVNAPNMSLTEVRQALASDDIDEEQVILITHKRLPKWALVPIEQYQDLTAGVFNKLRDE